MNWQGGLLATVVLLVLGCGEPPSAQSVLGRYVMNKGRASDVLLVRSDGKWVHEYRFPTEPAIIDSGSWVFREVDNDAAVEFLGFTMRSRRETFPEAQFGRGDWVAFVERGWGGQHRFSVDDDVGWAYVQKE